MSMSGDLNTGGWLAVACEVCVCVCVCVCMSARAQESVSGHIQGDIEYEGTYIAG